MNDIRVEAFLNTHEQLLAAVDGLSQVELQWKPSAQAWSVQEVLSHLVDHSIVISFRIRDILAGTTNRLPAFHQDAWVGGQYSNAGSSRDILDVFRSLLHYNGLLFHRLNAADLAKTGVNVKGEIVSVSDIVDGFIRHVQNHLGQIEHIKEAAALV
ncbi:DinB family protein [Paenibacillus sp. DMB20]|uniref:DinB family protein n=1 Tax=Paenibacillus sp. DMB20 TaxID=1642570 RepID=UPI000627789A|nr:DinB family protein [Paenibacillus sp. DMB20]KKO52516.1 hypothetical protein XI25_20385 [Paenibacillus sp. DMB20]